MTSKWAKGTGGPAGDECQNLVAVWTKSKRAQSVDDDETWIEGGVSPTLNAFDQGDTRATVLAFGHTQGIDIQPSDTSSPTVAAQRGGAGVQTGAAVRRLTPVECERLMGWPDDHTRWGVDDNGNVKEMSDSPRYRMIGNGVASPVAAWIGKHLLAVDGDA